MPRRVADDHGFMGLQNVSANPFVLGNTYVMICGGVLVATGITANNPAYEDTKSSAFTTNKMVSMMIISFTPQGILFGAIFFRAFWIIDNIFYFILANSLPIILMGIVLCFIGTRRLSRSETVY